MTADDSRVADGDRIQLSRPRKLAEWLDTDQYPANEFPTLESEQDLWLRAVEDLRAESKFGEGDPTDLYDLLVQVVETNGGAIPVTVDGDDWIAGGPSGGVRATTDTTDGVLKDDIQHMDVKQLTETELADLMAGAMDPERLYRALATLTVADEDIDYREGVFRVAHHANVSLSELLAYAVETEAYSRADLQQIVEDL